MKINTLRNTKLGQIAEEISLKILPAKGFTNIVYLNKFQKNYKFADIGAERNGKRYAISVKGRNKFEINGKINSRYKLDGVEHAEEVAKNAHAIPAFIAVQFDNENGTFSIYFGELSVLNGNKAVLMGEQHLRKYECLGKDLESDFEYSNLLNSY